MASLLTLKIVEGYTRPVVMVGYTVYRSNTGIPCTKQLMQAFDTYGKPVVDVHEVPLPDVSNYGICRRMGGSGQDSA